MLLAYGVLVILTYKYRIRDGANSTRRALRASARSVNFVWNYCCQIDREAQARWKAGINTRRQSAFDLANLCRGVTRELGLKTLATLSNGEKIEMPAFYRKSEARLALHQQRGQKVRARSLAAKIANQRKDFLHKVSTSLVKAHDRIVVGDVSPSRLKRTNMAKSVSDAGWSMLRMMLQYKSIATGATCEIVSERYSSATCSACGARSGPKGIAGLRIREWVCSECGSVHDRDQNGALNILLGAERRPLAEEIRLL